MTTNTTAPTFVYQGHESETIALRELPLADIRMPGFQRDRVNRHIVKMAGEFDATAYAFPIVATFREEFICLDGQQRLATVELRGEAVAVVALVEGVKTAERLARIFLHVNRDRKLLDAFQKYIGALAAKDQGTVNIERIVADAGLGIGKSATQNGKVPAGAIVWIYEKGGGDLLERVLLVRESAWGSTPSRESFESKTLVGLATFLARHHEKVEDQRLVDVLGKHHPGWFLDKTSKLRTVTYADCVREEYNRGLRGSRKL